MLSCFCFHDTALWQNPMDQLFLLPECHGSIISVYVAFSCVKLKPVQNVFAIIVFQHGV